MHTPQTSHKRYIQKKATLAAAYGASKPITYSSIGTSKKHYKDIFTPGLRKAFLDGLQSVYNTQVNCTGKFEVEDNYEHGGLIIRASFIDQHGTSYHTQQMITDELLASGQYHLIQDTAFRMGKSIGELIQHLTTPIVIKGKSAEMVVVDDPVYPGMGKFVYPQTATEMLELMNYSAPANTILPLIESFVEKTHPADSDNTQAEDGMHP